MRKVAPYTGAWIEILNLLRKASRSSSLPTRERGLKYCSPSDLMGWTDVAPYTGAWIEIDFHSTRVSHRGVAPYTGAWIEITLIAAASLSSCVAPYTGAWIEIMAGLARGIDANSRSLHGSVD